MQLRILAGLTFGGLALFFLMQSRTTLAADQPPSGKRVPVIVELFTSEGCSSCPPADALLRKLEETQPVPNAEIIVLGEHVDYWNYIGWTDRFSSKDFTQRQEQYARIFNLDSAYTPQMVIDGRTELNGGDESSAKRAIADAAKHEAADINLQLRKNAAGDLSAAYNVSEAAAKHDAELVLLVTEANLETEVKAGENNGHSLRHTGVVRWWKKFDIGKTSANGSAPIKLDPSWKPADIRVIAYLQEKNSRHIIGAAAARLSEAKL
jgi:hypothetical protein